jgi:phosphohistidine phosphatase
MELILWRHAEAEDGLDDAKRILTKRGRKQAERVARWLRPRLEGDWRILVSPAERTLQTAKPLDRDFEVEEAVGTSATAAQLLRAARWPRGGENVLVVGHQPTLGQVVAQILDASGGEFSIRKGALWWLAARDGGEVLVKAVLGPELAE